MKFDNPNHPDHERYNLIVNRILWIPLLLVFQYLNGEMISQFFLTLFRPEDDLSFIFYWWLFFCDIFFILILRWQVFKVWIKGLIGFVKYLHGGIINILRGQ